MLDIKDTSGLRFEIDASGDPVQILAPPDKLQRFEGVAFSSSGDVLGVASTIAVLLYRRNAEGLFEDTPYWSIGGLGFPHDVSFSRWALASIILTLFAEYIVVDPEGGPGTCT